MPAPRPELPRAAGTARNIRENMSKPVCDTAEQFGNGIDTDELKCIRLYRNKSSLTDKGSSICELIQNREK